ncbi:McrB family protein [Halobacillus sp. Marseille-Q1614]|uniref:McrB family protein n=1 Tax=Halobacillus sp. Marseille-Q1614 TaxID=2709134 RepID=UPI00156E592C|nr:AAA family ATPase [Halobacillus sp. Marseille-Q1614]
MLKRFVFDFAKQLDTITTLQQKAVNKIVSANEEGINVETEASRSKFQNGMTNDPSVLIKKEWFDRSLEILQEKRTCAYGDFTELGMRHSFFLGFLANLPFVESKENKVSIKQFDTLDLPESTLEQVLSLLRDLVDEKYTASTITQAFKEDSVRRLKSRARQSLRLLGYLDNEYNLIENDTSLPKLRKRILSTPYVHMVYDMLTHMRDYSIKEKQEVLYEVAYLTVVSSKDGTRIKQSVAEYRTKNIIQWLKFARIIDEDWNVIHMESTKEDRQYWWVNQGQTKKGEKEGGFLWAPKANKNGRPLAHHTDLLIANLGDIVFAYSQGTIHSICEVIEPAVTSQKPFGNDSWQEEGNLLKVKYHEMNPGIDKSEIPLEWREEETGPFDRNGDVKQGYFYTVSDSFVLKLVNQFKELLPKAIKEKITIENKTPIEDFDHFDSDSELLSHIYHYIKSEGLYYKEEEIKSLYLSLKTKPFVILSGISGTGKTKIVEKFAASLGATEENGRFSLIPVRPDWSDGSDLIGFEDIKGEFKPGPLTEVLIDAELNLYKPYFVLLDEMNLARVEYYFSDLLSVMESRKKINGKIVTSEIPTPESYNHQVIIPENVYIIGTVNMDETTHPFSSKVLDRANTMEFNDVALDFFPDFIKEAEVASAKVDNNSIKPQFITLKDAFPTHEKLIRQTTEQLIQVNEILKKNSAHFGYRIRDEICYYMIYNQQSDLMEPKDAFDRQLLQKVLPKLNGSDAQTANMIEELFHFCTGQDLNYAGASIQDARYPLSAQKLETMYRNQQQNGFTSFWLG